jgi:hypothetical protein
MNEAQGSKNVLGVGYVHRPETEVFAERKWHEPATPHRLPVNSDAEVIELREF